MNKDDQIELTIEDMGIDGAGIGKIDGMTFFVKDAVIGDKVTAKVMKLKKTYGYARLLEIKEPSVYRTEPKCPLHRQCGGCQIQPLSYEKQLAFKQQKIKNNLVRIGGFLETKLPMHPIIGAQTTYHYRNKTQFPVGKDKQGQLIAGFYAARTHSIIPVQDCYLGIPQNRKIMQTILSWMNQYEIQPYDEKTGTGLIRHVLIRCGFWSKQLMVCIVINGESLTHAKQLICELTKLPEMTSISISINRERNNVIMGNEVKTLWGKDYIEDSIGGVRFQISPLSFYQINPVQTEVLYQKVMEYAQLTGAETVWDLYCGIGTISLFLAQHAKKVYGVEIVPQAVADAKQNAQINGIPNADFFAGRAEDILPQYYEQTKQEGLKQYPQVIVVDPPRKGCEEKLLDTMIQMHPERIVYVSCDSATLARDLKYLCGHGYELTQVQGVDLFCQTVHVETVVQLTRKR